MTHELITRIFIYTTIAVCVGYDIACETFGWPTISHVLRQIDDESSGLLRYLSIGLWLHLWGPLWSQLR